MMKRNPLRNVKGIIRANLIKVHILFIVNYIQAQCLHKGNLSILLHLISGLLHCK